MAATSQFWGTAYRVWHLALGGLALLMAVLAAGHALLYKRDSRAAIAWVGFIGLVPLVGAVLYFVFGVNRLRRQAASLRGKLERIRTDSPSHEGLPEELHPHWPAKTGHLHMLARVVGNVVQRPLTSGNRIEPLVDGDEAYPAMLQAIDSARQTLSLETYIFDRDSVGMRFAQALGQAVRRGVEVRLLIDAAGIRYSWPSILPVLRREKVRYARFLPASPLAGIVTLNMRTHRKILVADGRIGFTGGMNIRQGHCLKQLPPHPVQDIHFRVEGPAVSQMQEVFAEDWWFASGETLERELWFPNSQSVGPVLARGVPDGPDEDFEKLRWTLLGAISIARHAVKIVTPYFVPDSAIISALSVAAMRGVQIDILLPAKNNLPFVHWASRAMWWQLLEHGCRIWLTRPPFDHSKLMLVDGCWALLGSANWDARSLRLNFEYNLECYDPQLVQKLETLVEKKKKEAHLVTLEEVDARALPGRLRDGIARLLTPYL